MKRSALIAVLLSGAAVAGGAQTESDLVHQETVRIGDPARVLLEAVLAHLPQEPLMLTGEAIVRKQKGIVVSQFAFEMFLNWGANPSTARYTLLDNRGRTLEQLTISRATGDAPAFTYTRGDPPVPAELPDLCAPVQSSDFSWMDLSLSFLWWPEGTVIGNGEIMGRECHLVELKNPDTSISGGSPQVEKHASQSDGATYAKVILWIDRQFPMLLRAEGYNSEGKLVRRLWVKSLKKIDERWMVKDMEVQQYPSPHRTRIHVSEVKPVN